MALCEGFQKAARTGMGHAKYPTIDSRRRGRGAAPLPIGLRQSFLALPPKAEIFLLLGKWKDQRREGGDGRLRRPSPLYF